MRLFSRAGRAALLTADGPLDVARASGGRFGPDIAVLYPQWDDFLGWAATLPARPGAVPEVSPDLDPVSPRPSQIFAIGLNYVDHAAESGFAVPEHPIVFTKFASALAGPYSELELSSETVDWEIELVVVIGRPGRNVPAERAWQHVAGLTIGQDYSDRTVQFEGAPAQFSLGKSFPGFAPIGPVLVTPEEFLSDGDPVLECRIDGEVVQTATLSDLVFSVPELIRRLSSVVTLRPGDLVFTGTPPGVGFGREPRRYLRDGEVVTSSISGLGHMEQTCSRDCLLLDRA